MIASILRTILLAILVVPATLITCYMFWWITMWQYHNAPWLLVGAAVMLGIGVVVAWRENGDTYF